MELIGCQECRRWARLKHEHKLPVAGDTYCGTCGTREVDVSRSVREYDRHNYTLTADDGSILEIGVKVRCRGAWALQWSLDGVVEAINPDRGAGVRLVNGNFDWFPSTRVRAAQ